MAITISGSGITSANIADGTIVNADVADVAASKLTGALPAIDGSALTNLPGGGKVLQVVSFTDTSITSTTSSTFVTGYSVSITPTLATSKILVMSNTNIGSAAGYPQARLARGSTAIGSNTSTTTQSGNLPDFAMYHAGMTALDSPATTSATTYTVQLRSAYNSVTCYINAYPGSSAGGYSDYRATGASTITVMEIGV